VPPREAHVGPKRAIGRRAALLAMGAAAAGAAYAVYAPRRTAHAEARSAAASRAAQASEWMLPLPARPSGARTASEILHGLTTVAPGEREQVLVDEVLAGNVPDFLRTMVPLRLTDGRHEAWVKVAPDYLAVGSEEDFVRIPLTPASAQRVADACSCVLPTPKLVDEIYKQAIVRLAPEHLPLELDGMSSGDFGAHHRLVERARMTSGHRLGQLLAGHKKDVVLTGRLATASDRVAIYGFHGADGRPLQVLSLVHLAEYVDYSHAVRLVSNIVRVNGEDRPLAELLRDQELATLLTDEGPMALPRYPA
jgi:hypothetical protein